MAPLDVDFWRTEVEDTVYASMSNFSMGVNLSGILPDWTLQLLLPRGLVHNDQYHRSGCIRSVMVSTLPTGGSSLCAKNTRLGDAMEGLA
eukprot:1288961-Amphidinium_carterae.1